MVELLFLFLFAANLPFDWVCPQSVQPGETFSLEITSIEPGCSGISVTGMTLSQGLRLHGSSTSTSISSVTTTSGRQLTQVVQMVVILSATPSANADQSIGPFQVNLHGIGTYTFEEISIQVETDVNTTTLPSVNQSYIPDEEVWLMGILHDTGGRIYPGTRLKLDYYVYSLIGVDNVSYWWGAPELGVILDVDAIQDSNWESTNMKHYSANRSLLAVVEMAPAAAGSLFAPVFAADITGSGYDRWGKSPTWTVESEPLMLPVYPFPLNAPWNWDETLLDSITVKIEQLPNPSGQGGELSIRLTSLGPGNIYMDEAPIITVKGNASLIQVDSGSTENKKWWDFILEPEETGVFILGPDSLVWLNRYDYTYQTTQISPCTVDVTVIPWTDRVIELEKNNGVESPILWIIIGTLGVLTLTVILGRAAKRKEKQLVSVLEAKDVDELLSGMETELSQILTGGKSYLGYEELDEYLNNCNVDSFLSRRILRFWRNLEISLSEKEITILAFIDLKKTANELLEKLKKQVESHKEKE